MIVELRLHLCASACILGKPRALGGYWNWPDFVVGARKEAADRRLTASL